MARSAKEPYSPDKVVAGMLPKLRQSKSTDEVVLVSGRQLAKHLDLSLQRITQLASIENVFERLPSGKFDQTTCRVKYLRWLRDPERRSARTKADADFVKAKTELIAIRVAEKKRDLVELTEALEVMERFMGVTLTAMGGMAARVGGSDMQLRRKVDQIVFETRTQLANAYEAFADERQEPPFRDGKYVKAGDTEEDDEAKRPMRKPGNRWSAPTLSLPPSAS